MSKLYKKCRNITTQYLISNEVSINLYLLSPLMKHRIRGNMHCSFIIINS